MTFLHRNAAKKPLTEDCMQKILTSVQCRVRYRFDFVLAVDRSEQEYYVCLRSQLASMTVQQFAEALATTLSIRVGSQTLRGIPASVTTSHVLSLKGLFPAPRCLPACLDARRRH